jgi:hypothetical protein
MSEAGIPAATTWTGDIPCWSCRLHCPAGCDCACHDNDSARAAAERAARSSSLHDALICAAEAVLAGEAGETREQETALFEARFAASGAFPIGSREAEALGIILDAAGRVTEAAE